MSDPLFLTVEQVLLIHARQLAEHGGQEGIRDRGLLESAVAMPLASFGGEYLHDDVFAMAAAYAFHIAENQPCFDGNKRAAMGAALVFLRVNDIRISRQHGERLHEAMIAIAERRMKKDELASLLRRLGEQA
jgi:death on curing protein